MWTHAHACVPKSHRGMAGLGLELQFGFREGEGHTHQKTLNEINILASFGYHSKVTASLLHPVSVTNCIVIV